MTKDLATLGAQEDANRHGTPIVVTHNPYGEETEDENFGWIPQASTRIFKYETVVAIILPENK